MRFAVPFVLASLSITLFAQGRIEGPLARAFPLKKTEVHATVSGPVIRVVVRQVFENPFAEAIEAVYSFPLPDRAAVDGMTIEMGARRVSAEIHRRERARAVYEAAKTQGKTSALLTQQRPNVFTQHLANILPGERLVTELSYVEDLRYDAGRYHFTVPAVVGPRFQPPGEEQTVTSSPVTTVSPSRPDLAPRLTIEVELPCAAASSIDCSHPTLTRPGQEHTLVVLDGSEELPDRDFTLSWVAARDEPRGTLVAHKEGDEGYFTLTLIPEAVQASGPATPREVFLVLDCSGSMRGAPLEIARKVVHRTLDALSPSDSFQILRFSESASALGELPLPANAANVQRAHSYVEELVGGGGTMMIEGVRAALVGPRDPSRLRIVHFLTDGFISNEAQIFEELVRLRRGARFFPMGIGSSPNRYLIDRLAQVGRGAADFVAPDAGVEKIKNTVDRFVERVRQPSIVDLSIDWGGLAVTDVFPRELPDLFIGQPIVVHGRYTGGGSGVVVVRGRRGGQPCELRLELALPRTVVHREIPRLWARAQIADLMLETPLSAPTIEHITQLGLDHRILTAYTSFVAIEEYIVTEGGVKRTVRQPMLLPRGYQPVDATLSNDVIGTGGGAGGAFSNRRGGGRNLRSSEEKTAEHCVARSASFLAAYQSPDGRWDCDGFMTLGDPSKGLLADGAGDARNDVAVSSAALLTFLGAGSSHREGQYKANVRRGLVWLKLQQNPSGSFGPRDNPDACYGDAMAALAMIEAYGMTRSAIWKRSAERAIAHILDLGRKGEWRYGATPSSKDITVAAWMAMAVSSAQLAGLATVEDKKAARDLCVALPVIADDGDEARARALHGGILCLVRVLAGEDPNTSKALQANAEACASRPPSTDPNRFDAPHWYFGTLAMFQVGGERWVAWNESMKASIVSSMRGDGNFHGSWDSKGPQFFDGGRLLTSALMQLNLEIYYRYPRAFGVR